MKYTCPSAACGASITLDETYYRGGRATTCPRCSTRFTVALYCPTCSPRGIEEKQFLKTPAGFLGGETFRCPRQHTFTVPVLHGEAQEHLAGMGASIGTYSQSDRIDRLADANLKKQVSGGYCAGAVLDWIRRALLGGKVTYADVSPRQDRRAAVAWTEQSAATKTAFLQREMDAINDEYARAFKAKQLELNAAATAKDDAAHAELKRRTAEYAARQGMTQPMYDELVKLARAGYDLQIARIEDERQRGVAAAKATLDAERTAKTSSPVMERFWKEFATKMDVVLEKDRVARGKRDRSARGFSNLIVARAIEATEFPGVAALIEAVIRDPALQPNFAADVTIAPPTEGATGHAIGILRRNTGDRYVLFDPNYGTYEFTASNLRDAVKFLFLKAYPHSPTAVGADAHVYEINGRVKGGYTIFENAGASAPTVAPHLSVGAAAAAAAAPPPMLQPLVQ